MTEYRRRYIDLFFKICIAMVTFGYVFDIKFFINTFFFTGILLKFLLLENDQKSKLVLLKNSIDIKMIGLMVLFSISLMVSTYFSVNLQNSLKYTEHYIKWMFIAFCSAYILMFNLKTRDFEQPIIYGLTVGEIVIVIGVLWNYFVLDIQRPDSFFIVHPNATAGVMVFLLPFVILNNYLSKYVRLFLFIIITISLILTESRGAIIAYMVILIVDLFINKSYFNNIIKMVKSRPILSSIAIIFFICLFCSVFYTNNRFYEVFNTYDNLKRYYVGGDRLLLWESSLNIIKDYPIFGIGLNNFNFVYLNGYISEYAREPNLQSPHNIILHFLVETGVFGGVCLLLIFRYQLLKLFKHRNDKFSYMYFLAIISILIHGMVDYVFLKKAFYQLYWFICGLIWINCNAKDEIHK